MRLLPILLLCSHCLLGSPTVIDENCNDQNVFNAVDEALKSFNNEKEEGNQFILYRITDAKLKTEGGQIHHFVEYETDEGSCDVKSGKSWQECSSIHQHHLKCSAHVLFNKDLNLRSVKSQNCSIPEVWPTVTAVHRPCLGCPHPIDKENKELLCFVHSTIEQVNKDSDHPFYFDLETIVNATRQVVYGWTYDIYFLIKQTNCSKSNFADKNSIECKIDNGEKSIECKAQVYVTPDGKAKYPFLECRSETGVCINCPVDVDPNDPELQTLLVQVMDEYNFNSNHSELYNVAFVDIATKKGFQRKLYDVTFVIGPTNCSKYDYSILGNECDLTDAISRLLCKTKINVTDKTANVHLPPYCERENRTILKRISGLSPLRISRNVNNKHNDRNDMSKLFTPVKGTKRSRQSRHLNDSKKEHKHGKKEKKDKQEKNEHKHRPQGSSEEDDKDAVPQATLQKSEVSNNQGIFPNTEEISLLDFSDSPTEVVPRCPGSVWQPKRPSIPTVKTFSIDDLVFALDDLTPSSVQDIEKNELLTPKQTSDFNDEDLLG